MFKLRHVNFVYINFYTNYKCGNNQSKIIVKIVNFDKYINLQTVAYVDYRTKNYFILG